MEKSVETSLNELVIGQQRAKELLARLVDMHFSWFDQSNRMHRAPNALVIGPTGTGKTHAITTVANALRIPLVVVDSTRLVATGATQQITFEEIVIQLVKSARQLAKTSEAITRSPEALAERGIIFLDEFDKLRYSSPEQESAAIQRRLLQFIEGETIFLEQGEREAPRSIDTHGILFVAAGAFSGIRSKRVVAGRAGVTSRVPEIGRTIQPQDVHEFGIIYELVARLPIIIPFQALGRQELRQILDHRLVSPFNFYFQYFKKFGVEIEIPTDTRDLIAEEALQASEDLGARGLHQELFPVLSAVATELVTAQQDRLVDRYKLTPAEYRRYKARAFQVPEAVADKNESGMR
jgi:ATP-dependent Clp protease ATP-binding subunit ClpX